MDYRTNDSQFDEFEIRKKLKGKTLRVYWYLLQNPRSISLREIQLGSKLSSPSLASYHLDKLVQLDLVSVNAHGIYKLKKDFKIGVLRLFVGKGKYLVPRYLFYAVFYTAALPISLLIIPQSFGPLTILLMFILIFGAVSSWLEVVRAWKLEI